MLIYVPLTQIDDNPYQERFSYDDVPDLAARIQVALGSYPDSYGLMQIPRGRGGFKSAVEERLLMPDDIARVLTTDDRGRYLWPGDISGLRVQIAFGHRRLRAMRHLYDSGAAGYEEGLMPLHIDALTDQQMLDAVWEENQARSDISPLERARLLQKKMWSGLAVNGNGQQLTQAEVGQAWGLARATVANSLRLLELPTEVQVAVHDGTISQRTALDLLPVVELQEAAESLNLHWGDGSPTATWGRPAKPQRLIQSALDGKATSEEIREYSRRLTEHIGTQIPKRLMAHDCGEAEGIIQPLCAGCPHLVRGNICTYRAKPGIPPYQEGCLAEKIELAGQALAANYAAKTGLTLSNNDDSYLSVNYNGTGTELLDAFDAGESHKIVIAWRAGWGIRPWAGGDRKRHVTGANVLKNDMASGLMIGWHPDHDPARETASDDSGDAAETKIYRPDWDTRDGWSKLHKDLVELAVAELAEAINDWLGDSQAGALLAMLHPKGGQASIRALLNDRLALDEPDDVLAARQRLAPYTNGLPPLSPAYVARLWASYALPIWWQWHGSKSYYSWNEQAEFAAANLALAYARRADLDDELAAAMDTAMESLAAARVEFDQDQDD